MGEILLSAVVITRNEEGNIERCLKSLQFADEIVVVDALSEDQTVAIATGLGARVIPREWPGFADQKQFAIDQTEGEWILLVDADEEVTEALAAEIEVALADGPGEPGFRIQRKNQFLGKWIDYGPWADDFQIRLFRKEKGHIARRPVHEGVQIDGEPGTLRSPLNHYTHQTLYESIHRLNVYTTLEAAERVSRRKIRIFDVIFPPTGVFLRYYFGGCWRAGMHGFLLAATTAMYKSVLYLKILLLQRDRDVQRSS